MNPQRCSRLCSELTFAMALLLLWASEGAQAQNTTSPLLESEIGEIDFSSQIRTILSDRCYTCHGPDANRREADLRLDIAESALESSIVPGQPDESELISRITSDDPDLIMPPPDSKLELTESEKKTLVAWVEQGAHFDEHWSFESITKPELPVGNATEAIDHCIDKRISAAGLPKSQPADRYTQIRRLYFDLTGLPPSLEEAQEFVEAEDAGAAYEELVDRLLASEHFGERMAVDWLDVARYADTYGYQNDRYRPMWPWRDWVVQAFNENLSYDQFVTWQIAGDLLPDATRDQILATAFNRNHRQTNEGGSVEEEYRAEYVADRVNTFGAAFLGLTLECCRCHDHKYDPITQREYYQFAAFFNSIDESGLYSHFTQATPTPTLLLSEAEQAERLAKLHADIRATEDSLAQLSADGQEYSDWRQSLVDVRPAEASSASENKAPTDRKLRDLIESRLKEAKIAHYAFEALDDGKVQNEVVEAESAKTSDSPQVVPGKVGNGVLLSGDNNVTCKPGGDFSRNQPFTISLWVNSPKEFERAVILHRSRAWTDSGSRGYELLIEDGYLSAGLIHFWPGNAMRVVSDEKLPVNQWTHVGMTYDGSSRASGVKLFLNGEPLNVKVVRDKLTKHIDGADGFGGGDARDVTIGQRFRDIGFKDGKVDELQIFAQRLTALEMHYVYLQDAYPYNLRELLFNATESACEEFFIETSAASIEMKDSLKKLRDEASKMGDPIPEIMVMREEPQPRKTHILIRGAYDAPGEEVARGTLKRVLPREYVDTPDRYDLAAWLVDPEHPLTSRVAVNRFWQMLFGRGLVDTPEDFGLQGSLPSHPELLDWLAKNFIESGWNVKQLLKQIVMSKAYRRSSDTTPAARQADPENRLLSRGPSGRFPAEMIRDSALASSGLLVRKLGGEPVKPYQPDGLWKEKSGQSYKRDAGEGSRRRSLYTYWKRTSPPPSMMTLDASNREVCVVERQVTMTPLQILVLLNDPQFVEAAKSLANRAMQQAPYDHKGQLRFVFQSLVTRPPTAAEEDVLSEMYEKQLEILQTSERVARDVDAELQGANASDADVAAASKLLEVGDFQVDLSLDPWELAALTIVADGLMSFDETVTKR